MRLWHRLNPGKTLPRGAEIKADGTRPTTYELLRRSIEASLAAMERDLDHDLFYPNGRTAYVRDLERRFDLWPTA